MWPQNVPVVRAWLAVSTQWRTAPLPLPLGGGPYWIGLDYAGVVAGLGALGIVVTPQLWSGLMIMEDEAIRALNGVLR